jgi:hypothetical protein
MPSRILLNSANTDLDPGLVAVRVGVRVAVRAGAVAVAGVAAGLVVVVVLLGVVEGFGFVVVLLVLVFEFVLLVRVFSLVGVVVDEFEFCAKVSAEKAKTIEMLIANLFIWLSSTSD